MEQNSHILVQALTQAQSVKISRSHSIQTADRTSPSLLSPALFWFCNMCGLLLFQMFFVKY